MSGKFICYFSGFTSSRIKKLLGYVSNGMKIDGICTNYFDIYCMRDKSRYIKFVEEINDYGVEVFLDSGAYPILHAYSYITGRRVRNAKNPNRYALKLIESSKYDEFIDDYINFLKDNDSLFKFYVEMDLQLIVGDDKVWEWRERFLNNDLEPMLVIHEHIPEKEIKVMCEFINNYGLPNIAISGPRSNDEPTYRGKMRDMECVRKYSSKSWIHFLAGNITYDITLEMMYRGLMNSIDNTTWVQTSQYGGVYVFDGKKMVRLAVGRIFRDSGWIKRINFLRKKFEEECDELVEYGFNVDVMSELFKNGRCADEWNWYCLYQFQKYIDYLNETKKNKVDVMRQGTLDIFL